MSVHTTQSSPGESNRDARKAGLPISEVVKDEKDLTNLSCCFSTTANDFVKYDFGLTRIDNPRLGVFFLNERLSYDSFVIAFARGPYDEFTSQAHSLATSRICEQLSDRAISHSICCCLPKALDIAERDAIQFRLPGIALDPRDFVGYEKRTIEAGEAIPNELKVEFVALASNLEIIKVQDVFFRANILLFNQGQGIRVALADSRETLTEDAVDQVVKTLFPDTVQTLYRPMAENVVIGSAAMIQEKRELVQLGKPTYEETPLPSLKSFHRTDGGLTLEYLYRGEPFTVQGHIEQRDNCYFFRAEGPTPSNPESTAWLHEALCATIELKCPDLGFISLDYKGSEIVRELVPTLKSLEALDSQNYLITLESGGNSFRFAVHRPAKQAPSLYVSGDSMGKLADNWVRMHVARIFSAQLPGLRYNGVHYTPHSQ